MFLPLVAILMAVLLGYLAGGRLRAFEELHLRWWPLAPIGLAMQLAPLERFGVDAQIVTWTLIASYPVLLLFILRNIAIPGFALLFIALAFNFLVIGSNGGMPVSGDAVERAGGRDALNELLANEDPKHHLMTGDDVLGPLADVIPVPAPAGQVASAGDVLAYSGLVWMVIGVMLAPTPVTSPRPRARRGYRGKHRPHRRPPPGSPVVLRPVAAMRSGIVR
jgi:uncharacterized protein DUF5317